MEHSKKTRDSLELIMADAFQFSKQISSYVPSSITKNDRHSWFENCMKMKSLLPVQEQSSQTGSVSIYDVIKQICKNCGDNDFLVSDAGSAYYVASIMFKREKSQRYITSGAQADMGFSLPAAVGVSSVARSTNSRVHAVTGDGSFQLNIQEIQTLVTYKLPVTLYVLNNNGYLSIRATQNSFFPGRQCGTDSSNGVEFPDLKLLSKAYNIPYRFVSSESELGLLYKSRIQIVSHCM